MQPHLITGFFITTAAALVAGRLFYFGLVRQFRSLVAWLAWVCLSTFSLAIISPKTTLYFWLYVAALPLDSIAGIIAVRELFALIFNAYPGIRTIGRWAMYGATMISLSVWLMSTKLFWSQTASGRAHSHIYYLQVAHRSVTLSLAAIILALLFSISRYPLHLGRNTYLSSSCFGVMFLSQATQSLIDSLAPRLHNDAVDWASNLFIAMCLLTWATWLQPETAPVPVSATFASPAEDHLLQQLAALNQMLDRAARR